MTKGTELAELRARLEAAERERDNWKMSAEEAERAEKRWERRASLAERERDRLDEAFDRDLPWRYDEVEAQRNQYAAVVEKVREADKASSSWDHFGHLVMGILATAPADALRELKAEAWDEGSETGFTHGMSYQAGNNSAMNYRNPYRSGS